MRYRMTATFFVAATLALLAAAPNAAAQDATAAARCAENPDTAYCLCRDGNRPPEATAFPDIRRVRCVAQPAAVGDVA